jgi:hypothetical protein
VLRTGLLAFLLAPLVTMGAGQPATASQAPIPAGAAPPALTAQLASLIEQARVRFEARDLAGVLASVSEQYRSSGMTKAAVREQLVAMFALHQQLRARVTLERVHLVAETAWVYTSGEVSGRLPLVGWVTVLSWQGQPEVARREGEAWRLFGFQD